MASIGAPLEEDLRRIEAVIKVVGDGNRLAVDAMATLIKPPVKICSHTRMHATCYVMDELGGSSRRIVPHGGHQISLNIAAGFEATSALYAVMRELGEN